MWFNKMVRGSIKVIKDGVKRMDSQDKQKKPVLTRKSEEDTEDSNLEEEKCQKLEWNFDPKNINYASQPPCRVIRGLFL